jgi:ATP-binding cassette, subfamily B, multidrug efflux pump
MSSFSSPSQAAPAPSNRYSRLRKLLGYMRPHWRATVIGVVTLFIVNVLGTYLPQLIGQSIDGLGKSFQLTAFWPKVALLVGLASIMFVIRMVSRIALFGTGRQIEFDLKQGIFEHLLTLEPAYFARNTIGDIINRATSDVDSVRRLVGFAVLSLVNTLFAYALTLPAMLMINPLLSLAALAVYPLILLLVKIFSGRLQNQQLEVQNALSDMSELIQEDISGISLIKIYAQEANERLEFQQLSRRLLKANLQLARTRNILFPILGGLASVSLLVLLWFGGREIANGRLSVGDFVKMLLYIERLIFPTALLGFTITAYQRGEVSIDRIETILQAQPTIQTRSQPLELAKPVRGKLTARDLTFTYPGAKTPALNQVEFAIQPGETVAVVGPVGSGKSTLANVLPRLLEIEPGQLFLDDTDITQISLSDLRAAIAYVPQDSFLFSTSLKNNIRYGNPAAAQLEVEHAAKQSQIAGEIQYFPQQYDTLVGERGITLSGGQRQRTALARALIVDAPILVLDDALSSVDNETATAILKNLSRGEQQRTVVFISHQLAAVATADRILVMDQGKIIQEGHHSELVSQPGLYQELWNKQQLEELLR